MGKNGPDAFWSVKLREIRKLFQCRPFRSIAPWKSPPTACLTNEPRCIALLHLPPIVSTTFQRRDRLRNISRKTAAPPTIRGAQGNPTKPRQRHFPIPSTDLRESSPKGPAHAKSIALPTVSVRNLPSQERPRLPAFRFPPNEAVRNR